MAEIILPPALVQLQNESTENKLTLFRSLLSGQVGMDLHWENGGGYSTGVISAGTAPTYTPQGRSLDIYMAATTLGDYCVNLDGNGTASQKQLFLPGSIGTVTASSLTVDWSKSWMMRFVMVSYLGAASGAKFTVQVGVDASLRSHTLNTKSVGFRITEGAKAATIAAIAHNGTTEAVQNAVATSSAARTFTDKVWELVYLAGTGLYLYCDGALLATVAAASLPSGTGTAGAHTLQFCFLSGGASSAGIRIRIEQIQFFRL